MRRLAPLVCAAACLITAAPAHAAATWDRSFGSDVGGPGIDVCTLATNCVVGDTSGTSGATLVEPSTAAADSSGNVYVADHARDRVVKFTHDGAFVRAWGWGVNPAAPAAFGNCTTEATCLSGSDAPQGGALNGPVGIAVSPTGTVYVTEYDGHRISQFDIHGNFLRTTGNGVNGGADYETCLAANAANCQTGGAGLQGGSFRFPRGIAFDATGNYHVAEWGVSRIDKFTPSDTFVWTAGLGVNGPGTFKCTARASCQSGAANSSGGGFWTPDGIGVGPGDTVWVTDRLYRRVTRYTTDGDWIDLWGRGVDEGGSSFEICTVIANCVQASAGDGPGEFRAPSGVTSDSAGLIYVSDRTQGRIQTFTTTGGIREVIGQPGPQGGELNTPAGIATTSGDELLVAEASGGRVSRFTAPVIPPVPTVLAVTPAGPANQNMVRITGTAKPGTTVRIWRGATCNEGVAGTGTAEEFASPGIEVTVADDSTTTFSAQALSGSTGSNCSSTSVSYTEDSTPPDTLLDSGDGSSSSSPTFLFHASEGNVSFQCRIDGAPFGPCFGPTGSHVISTPLAVGPHTFEVVASDAVGNTDPTPATATVNVPAPGGPPRDPAIPVTTITAGPSGFTSAAPSWTYTSSIPGSTFECRMDAGAFSACTPGQIFYALKLGDHNFYVRAVSPAGVRDPDPQTRAIKLGQTRKGGRECRGQLGLYGTTCPVLFATPGPSGYGPSPVCPKGAKCTMTVTATATTKNIQRALTVDVTLFRQPSETVRCDSDPSFAPTFYDNLPPSSDYYGRKIAPACPIKATRTFFGTGESFDASCTIAEDLRGPYIGYTPPANAIEEYSCTSSYEIVPVELFDTIPAGPSSGSTVVPGPGLLSVSTTSTTRPKLVVAAAKKKRVPLIKAVKVKPKQAGTVAIPFKLSAAAKKTLKKKRRLKLPLTLKFTPAGSKKATTKKVTITLTR